jgi:hypothetical protein
LGTKATKNTLSCAFLSCWKRPFPFVCSNLGELFPENRKSCIFEGIRDRGDHCR